MGSKIAVALVGAIALCCLAVVGVGLIDGMARDIGLLPTHTPAPTDTAPAPPAATALAVATATEPPALPLPAGTATPTPPPPAGAATPAPPPAATAGPAPEGKLVIHHFDVGQADATLIQAPRATVLIDAGDYRRSDVVPYLRAAGVTRIDLLILTHPHADHIGQVPQVMAAFPVGEVWMSGWEHTTQTFERALDAILASDAGYHEPRAGETLQLGMLIIEVVHPADPLQGIHDGLAVRIRYGEFAALYTGDAEADHEGEMLGRGHPLSAQVLQLGHHGSRTSTSAAFLQAVGPHFAVYSAGGDNPFGHPHPEVVDRLAAMGITLYGTDVHGTIRVISDGTSIRVEVERDDEAGARPGAPALMAALAGPDKDRSAP